MAEDTVDAVMRRLGRTGRCRTRRLRLARSEVAGGRRGRPSTTSPTGTARRRPRSGRWSPSTRSLADPLVPGLPYLRAEAVYAVRHEMATTLDDVLLRRTRAHLRDRAACLAAAADVATLLARELGWNAAETERQVAAYRDLCAAEERAARTGART